MNEFLGIMAVELIMGLSLIGVGFFVKKTRSGDLVSGFDPNLDNKDELAILFGNGMMLTGIIILFAWIIYLLMYFFIELEILIAILKYYVIASVLLIFGMCIKLYWTMNRWRKNN